MGGSIGDIIKNVVTLGAYGQKEAQKEAMNAQRQAEMQARKIAAEKKPMEETAKLALNPMEKGGGIMDLMINPEFKKKTTTGVGTGGGTTGVGA